MSYGQGQSCQANFLNYFFLSSLYLHDGKFGPWKIQVSICKPPGFKRKKITLTDVTDHGTLCSLHYTESLKFLKTVL